MRGTPDDRLQVVDQQLCGAFERERPRRCRGCGRDPPVRGVQVEAAVTEVEYLRRPRRRRCEQAVEQDRCRSRGVTVCRCQIGVPPMSTYTPPSRRSPIATDMTTMVSDAASPVEHDCGKIGQLS